MIEERRISAPNRTYGSEVAEVASFSLVRTWPLLPLCIPSRLFGTISTQHCLLYFEPQEGEQWPPYAGGFPPVSAGIEERVRAWRWQE